MNAFSSDKKDTSQSTADQLPTAAAHLMGPVSGPVRMSPAQKAQAQQSYEAMCQMPKVSPLMGKRAGGVAVGMSAQRAANLASQEARKSSHQWDTRTLGAKNASVLMQGREAPKPASGSQERQRRGRGRNG